MEADEPGAAGGAALVWDGHLVGYCVSKTGSISGNVALEVPSNFNLPMSLQEKNNPYTHVLWLLRGAQNAKGRGRCQSQARPTVRQHEPEVCMRSGGGWPEIPAPSLTV